MSAATPPTDLPPETAARLDLLRRRVPLLERLAELVTASLVEIQRRLSRLATDVGERPRTALGPRVERLTADLAQLRRQAERVRHRLGLDP